MGKYVHDYFDDEKIICRTFIGEISGNLVAESWDSLLADDKFVNRKYNVLSDYTGAKIEYSMDRLDEISNFHRDIRNKVPDFHHATATEDEKISMISFMIELEDSKNKTFSNREAAMEWLKFVST